VPDISESNCHAAPATPPETLKAPEAEALDRAIAMHRQLSEAEARLARLIDTVVAGDATEPDLTSP
jgi:hypothetical protein